MELSKETEQRVLEAVAAGERVEDVAAAIGVSHMTLWRYRKANSEFAAAFEAALADSADVDMLRLRDLANTPDPVAVKLAVEREGLGVATAEDCRLLAHARVDVRKLESAFRILSWYIARRAPAKYGDKIAVDLTQRLDLRAALSNADARLALLAERRLVHLPDVSTGRDSRPESRLESQVVDS